MTNNGKDALIAVMSKSLLVFFFIKFIFLISYALGNAFVFAAAV